MKCVNCNAALPQKAKFCPECGASVGATACPDCGTELKPDAKFCHGCGSAVGKPVESAVPEGQEHETHGSSRSWLTAFGPFLFIPIFAGIIVLLFWVNKRPQALDAGNSANGGQGAPSMAAMQQVHNTLERLKSNVEANPQDLVSIDSLAIMYSIAGSYGKAADYYKKHLEIEPDNKDVKIALALAYHNSDHSDLAIQTIQEVLDKEPTYAFGLFYLGEIYASTGNKDQAEENWQRIIDNYPGTEVADMAQQRIHEVAHNETSGSN